MTTNCDVKFTGFSCDFAVRTVRPVRQCPAELVQVSQGGRCTADRTWWTGRRIPETAAASRPTPVQRTEQGPDLHSILRIVLRNCLRSSVLTPMRITHVPLMLHGINDPPKEWRRPRGRPRQTRLRTIENDLKHQNLGLWSARHRAYDCNQWRDIVETATLLQGHAT